MAKTAVCLTSSVLLEKPKVKTVPLYRPKRSSDTNVLSCHVAIDEMAAASGMSSQSKPGFVKNSVLSIRGAPRL